MMRMNRNCVLGALVGDIIGSVYEFQNTKSTDFELFTPWSKFTDDSVMTLAVAKWLMEDGESVLHAVREKKASILMGAFLCYIFAI